MADTTQIPLIPAAQLIKPAATVVIVQDGKEWLASADKLRPWLDVRSYGAKGDGSTDDTAAIAACFAAAPTGATIVYPPGNYVQTTPITISANNITVIGYGATIISTATGQDRKFTATGRSGIVFRGLRFSGGGLTTLAASTAFDTYSPRSNPGTLHFVTSTDCLVELCAFSGLNWPITILGA